MKYNKYPSEFIINFKLGLIPQEILSQIPNSTKNYWRKNSYDNYFGCQLPYANEKNIELIKNILTEKKLLKVNKAMLCILEVYKTISQSSKKFKKIIKDNKELVLETIQKAKGALGLNNVLKVFSVSNDQFHAWSRNVKCAFSIFNKCIKRFPNQLTVKEVNVIKEYLTNPLFKGWSNCSIFYQMIRDNTAHMCKSTFYKYAHKLNLMKPRFKKSKYGTGIRAEKVKELFHMDVTIANLPNNVKAYIYILMDNYSRYILNASVALENKASITFQNINDAFNKYKIGDEPFPIKLMCDGGSENKEPVDTLLESINIEKLIAKKNIRFSNSMVEAVNKTIKYEFLFWRHFPNFLTLRDYLPKLIEQYNNKPHSALFGFTPKEVFNGLIPTKEAFNQMIKQDIESRKQYNLVNTCQSC